MALADVHATVLRVAKEQGLDEAAVNKLLERNKEHSFTLELKDGKQFDAYRVQHNNQLGPYKGGIRFHPEVSLDEVRTLATLMSLKTAAVGLPLGGGKGGVVVDPKLLTDEELEHLSRQFVQHLAPHIGPDKDIPAPDVNTNPRIIDWMVDEYEQISGDTTKASFTGKSLPNGGSEGRTAATGRGGVITLREVLKKLQWSNWPVTMAVQGFGNVGSYFATVAQAEYKDWKLVAATDSSGGVVDENGLDAAALDAFKSAGNRLVNAEGAGKLSADDIFAQDVDVLVLGALGDAVNKSNMHLVKAKIILELANGPLSDDARNYLTEQGVVIIPDILANAGGVVVSYLEWQQNLNGEHWTEEAVNEKLEHYLSAATQAVWDEHEATGLSLADATISIALKRLLVASK